jgi:hypothetical protein
VPAASIRLLRASLMPLPEVWILSGTSPGSSTLRSCHCKKLSIPSLKGTTAHGPSSNPNVDWEMVTVSPPSMKLNCQLSPVTYSRASTSARATAGSFHRSGALTGMVSSMSRGQPLARRRTTDLSAKTTAPQMTTRSCSTSRSRVAQ